MAIRRILLLDFDDETADRPAGEVPDDGWSDSIVAANTMATRWFDGETDLGGRPGWSHLWDQCFATVDQYEAHRRGASRAAAIEAALVSRAVRNAEVVYVPELGGVG